MPSKAIRVLVVDDEPDLRQMIASNFQLFGLSAQTAENGNEAWDILSREQFQVVVTDIKMPNGNGLELLERIKGKDVNYPKVYFISGFTEFSNEEVFDRGADGLFKKPFSSKEISTTIRTAFESKNLRWGKRELPGAGFEVKFQVDKITDFKKAGFKFGRGGFFFRLDGDVPEENQKVVFRIDIGDKNPAAAIEGEGKTMWVRRQADTFGPVGVGVEINYLKKDCRTKMASLLETLKLRPYIPRG